MTPEIAAEIEAYTAGVLAARREYELHPFTHQGHGLTCARRGCKSGLRVMRAKQRKST